MNRGRSSSLQITESVLRYRWSHALFSNMISYLDLNSYFPFLENRLSEMARMGIGNKPCLDIKPSKDNINDRFVNIHNRSEYFRI